MHEWLFNEYFPLLLYFIFAMHIVKVVNNTCNSPWHMSCLTCLSVWFTPNHCLPWHLSESKPIVCANFSQLLHLLTFLMTVFELENIYIWYGKIWKKLKFLKKNLKNRLFYLYTPKRGFLLKIIIIIWSRKYLYIIW